MDHCARMLGDGNFAVAVGYARSAVASVSKRRDQIVATRN